MHRLDLHSLRLFAAVVKDGSISRAAERSHIAASALSRRLADLEHIVGAPLFTRSRKGIAITEVGRVVLQHAERIHDELRHLLDAAAALQAAQTTVRLHASHSVIGGVLPELLRAFQPIAENVRVEISEANSMEVVTACADGFADIGIGLGVLTAVPGTVESWTLAIDRLQVVLHEDHLLARARGVSFAQALAFPLIGSDPAGALCALLQRQAQQLGLEYGVQISACNFSAACRLAESGLGLAIMPGTAIPVDLAPPLVHRPLTDTWADRPLNLYASRKRARSAGTTALLQHLRRRFQAVRVLRDEVEAQNTMRSCRDSKEHSSVSS
jgi:DNA-binding transcriptional LysR family regulator